VIERSSVNAPIERNKGALPMVVIPIVVVVVLEKKSSTELSCKVVAFDITQLI